MSSRPNAPLWQPWAPDLSFPNSPFERFLILEPLQNVGLCQLALMGATVTICLTVRFRKRAYQQQVLGAG